MYFRVRKVFVFFIFSLIFFIVQTCLKAEEVREILEGIQKDLRTLERAVDSMARDESISISSSKDDTTPKINSTKEEEQALAKHLLKVGDLERANDLVEKLKKPDFYKLCSETAQKRYLIHYTEKIWKERETHLDHVPGFKNFNLVVLPE
mgnify:CR=1 FL=1